MDSKRTSKEVDEHVLEEAEQLSIKATITDARVKFLPSRKLYSFLHEYLKDVPDLLPNIMEYIAVCERRNESETSSESSGKNEAAFESKALGQSPEEQENDDSLEPNIFEELLEKQEGNDDEIIRENTKESLVRKHNLTGNFSKRTLDYNDSPFLYLEDLKLIYNYICDHKPTGVYFHELLEGTEVIIPENNMIPRSEELENRCRKLEILFKNQEYHKMTRKVSFRRRYPDDTLAYQMKEMDKQLIAVFQLILSIFAGFAFGFFSTQLFEDLKLEVRLFFGIGIAITVGAAELYFLLKKICIVEECETKNKENLLSLG